MIKSKKLLIVIFVAGVLLPAGSRAQTYDLERLILDIEKLAQLKDLLSDLYKGYEILSTGYNTIKDISEGNFNLHKAFLDGLLAVSPAVQKYERVTDIISDQANIISEYKTTFNRLKQNGHFNPDEISYLLTVYNNLIDGSEKNLEDLLDIITADKLRMNDAERLHAIDGIYRENHERLMFLRHFNETATLLDMSRAHEENEVRTLRGLNGIE